MTQRSFGTLLRRALRLRCPRCGGGRLFVSLFKMNPVCPRCKLRYERESGYFLGSAYINYGITAFILTAAYIALRFGAGFDNRTLIVPLMVFCILFPLFFFRYARSLWLAMDCYFDVTGFDPDRS